MRLSTNLAVAAAVLASFSIASYAGPFVLTAKATEVGNTNLPFDPACPAYTVNPACSPNSNLQAVAFTAPGGFDFTSDPNYHNAWTISSISITFSMIGVDTTASPYLNQERLWLNGQGTGISANGFDATHQTLTFVIPAGNGTFPNLSLMIRSNGNLTGQIRNVANVLTPVNFSGTATITINADSVPEPATIGFIGVGIGGLAVLRFLAARTR